MLHKMFDNLKRGLFGTGLAADPDPRFRTVNMLPTKNGGGGGATNYMLSFGDVLPSAVAGYAVGGLFILLNPAAGTQALYANTGTAASCTFTKITDLDNLTPVGNLLIATGKTLTVTDIDALLVGGIKIPNTFDMTWGFDATTLAVATDIWVPSRAYQVTKIQEVHSVVSSGGANVKIRKITDTSAPGAAAGANVLELIDSTNSTVSALDLTSAINTVKAAAARVLNTTASVLQVAADQRVAVFPASAPTGYVGVLTITVKAI